jgi:hypothetical protein
MAYHGSNTKNAIFYNFLIGQNHPSQSFSHWPYPSIHSCHKRRPFERPGRTIRSSPCYPSSKDAAAAKRQTPRTPRRPGAIPRPCWRAPNPPGPGAEWEFTLDVLWDVFFNHPRKGLKLNWQRSSQENWDNRQEMDLKIPYVVPNMYEQASGQVIGMSCSISRSNLAWNADPCTEMNTRTQMNGLIRKSTGKKSFLTPDVGICV